MQTIYDSAIVVRFKISIKIKKNKSDMNVRVKPRKFSSFFKSLVIELDKDLYGPDNHLVEVICQKHKIKNKKF